MKIENRYQRLVANTAIMGVGTFGSKVLVLFLMRFYTSILSEGQLGTGDLIMMYVNLLIPVVSIGFINAIIRFGLDETENKKSVLSNALFVIFSGFILFACFMPIIAKILPIIANDKEIAGYAYLIYIGVCMSLIHSAFAVFIRSSGRITLYAIDGILSTVWLVLFWILFLAVFKMGIAGYVLATACSDLVSAVFLFFAAKLYRSIRLKIRLNLLKSMTRYAIPLIPNTVLWWVTTASDRTFVTNMLGPAANGLYAAANKIPTVIVLLASTFLEAWQISAVTQRNDRDIARFFTKVVQAYSSLIFVASAVIIAFCQIIIRILVAPKFFGAWEFVPILVLAIVFSCLANFLGSVYMVEKKNSFMFVTTGIGAGLNILLNFILIPSMGVNGAALATCLSYLLIFLARAVHSRRFIKIKWNAPRLTLNTVLLSVQVVIILSQVRGWFVYELILMVIVGLINVNYLINSAKLLLGKRKGAAAE